MTLTYHVAAAFNVHRLYLPRIIGLSTRSPCPNKPQPLADLLCRISSYPMSSNLSATCTVPYLDLRYPNPTVTTFPIDMRSLKRAAGSMPQATSSEVISAIVMSIWPTLQMQKLAPFFRRQGRTHLRQASTATPFSTTA